jgi:hypothetical protein
VRIEKRWLAIVMIAVWVSGCAATTAVNNLSQEKRDSLRIDAIDLSFAPDAVIAWGDALNEFWRSGKPDTPEARRAFLQQKVTPHIKAALNAEILPAFRGRDPARLKVVVRFVNVAPVVLRLLAGGNYMIKADIAVVDGKTGRAIVEAPDFNGSTTGGSGPVQVLVEQMFPDPIDRVSRQFAGSVKDWLQTGQAFAEGRNWSAFYPSTPQQASGDSGL